MLKILKTNIDIFKVFYFILFIYVFYLLKSYYDILYKKTTYIK